MNFGFLSKIPWLKFSSNESLDTTGKFASTVIEQEGQKSQYGINAWGLSLVFSSPWALNNRDKEPTTINRGLQRRTQSPGVVDNSSRNAPLRFRPYVSKVPWHTGPRALLSQLFPRYGHYCGPNWSSGKNSGSPVWDRRPIDWLDFCCYCHDIGYDTHDQAMLLKADLAFLECLEKPYMTTKGNVHVANLYKTMCITGLRNILIPYRMHLVNFQSGMFSINFGWLSNCRWKGWDSQKGMKA